MATNQEGPMTPHADLVARLRAMASRFDMTSTERYEQDSEAFYAATGYMAPGKDVPMAMGGQNETERRTAHEAWIASRNRSQQQAIQEAADALAALPPPADPRARGGRAMSADVLAALDERRRLRQTAPEAMTPADMAAWLRLDADAHEQAKAMSGPYEGSHTGDEDAARCRAIAQWIVDRHQADVTREFLLGALGPWYLKP